MDIRKAQSWYEEQQINLGTSLIESLDNLLLQLAKNPKAYAIRYRNNPAFSIWSTL